MKALSIFLSRHKVLNVIVCIISAWLIMINVDLYNVESKGGYPVCCMELKRGSGHYVGLGYSFDVCENPVSGNLEYAFYICGQEVKSNFTN